MFTTLTSTYVFFLFDHVCFFLFFFFLNFSVVVVTNYTEEHEHYAIAMFPIINVFVSVIMFMSVL